jgi:hypothetical protein
MSRRDEPLSPKIRALLDQEREVPPVPVTVRARALTRARAALATGSVVTRRAPPAPPSRLRWAAGFALACTASAAVAAAAYEIHARWGTPAEQAPATAPRPAPRAAPIAAPPAAPEPAPAAVNADVRPAPAHAPATHAMSKADAARAELRLLRQARAAVARQHFAAALPPIAEHTRRFKDGRLVEEREALRVKALAGLGRKDEARRAAAAFEARFPRSVLLPAVSKMPAAER